MMSTPGKTSAVHLSAEHSCVILHRCLAKGDTHTLAELTLLG